MATEKFQDGDTGGDFCGVNKIPLPDDVDVEEEEDDDEELVEDSPSLPTSLMVSFDASGGEGHYLCYEDMDDDEDGNMSPSSISCDDDEHDVRPFHDRRHEQQVAMEISSPTSRRQHDSLTATNTPSYRRQARLKLQDCEQRASRQFGRPPSGSPGVGKITSSPSPSSSLQLQDQQHGESSRSSSPASLSTNFRFQINNKNSASYSFGPRFCMILCASVLMMMSGLDEIINYNSNYAETPSLPSSLLGNGGAGDLVVHGRREEIVDFPLVVARAAASASAALEGTGAGGAGGAESTMEEHQPSPLKNKGHLPKYYFPKEQQVVGGRAGGAETASGGGGGLRHRHSNNLAMARASEHARPIFEEHPLLQQPHQQLSLSLQKFYLIDEKSDGFHNTRGSRIHRHTPNQQPHHQKRSLRRRFWSFVAWILSLALLSLVLDTSWREYRRSKTIEEEERRL